MSDDPLLSFAAELAEEVEENLSEDTPFSASVFTRIVLDRLEEAGHFDAAFELYQEGRVGSAIYRIDGYAFDEDGSRLDLFTTIHRGETDAARLAAADVTKAFERALRFASACLDGLADRLEPSNTDASDLARRIETEAAAITSVRIILLTDAAVAIDSAPPNEWKGRSVDFVVYDIVRLHRVLGEGETRADIAVDLAALAGAPVPCLHVPSGDGGYDAYLAVLPGDVLSRIYERYGVRLLELNVRAFLGLQGRKSVNAELRRTIVERPSMFLAYNNGIVATVDSIELEPAGEGATAIKSVRGLQIVNGGQTTASLHRARRKESVSVDRVGVPVKIIRVGGADLTEMVGAISRAANRQNTVQLADFSASDPFHQQVEELANNTWLDDQKGRWFYERARGSYVAAEQKASYRKSEQQSFRKQTPKQRRLSKLDVARYLSAWGGLPHRVCLGGQKNFQHFMQRLKDDPPPPIDEAWLKRLVSIAIIYRATERIVKSMKFPAYGAQIVAYVVSSMSARTGGRVDFSHVWAKQGVSSELEALVRAWAPQIDTALRKSAGQRNPSEWFKKGECWEELQDDLPVLTEPLPPELSFVGAAAMPLKRPVSVEDYGRIERCMEVEPETWLVVAERGQQAGIVHWKVAGICRTLASYAAGGWARKPSVKQAKPALEAFVAVQQAGLLGEVPSSNA